MVSSLSMFAIFSFKFLVHVTRPHCVLLPPHFRYISHKNSKIHTIYFLHLNFFPGGNFRENVSDPTGELAVKLAGLEHKIELVDKCLNEVGSDIYPWLKKCIVDGKSYNVLLSDGVPCGKEYFYQRYRSFFSRINLLI